MSNLKRAVGVTLALVAIVGLTACGGGDGKGYGPSTTNAGGQEEATSGGGGTGATSDEGDAMKHESGKSGEGTGAAGTTIVIKNGEPVGGVAELEYSAGEQVRFTVDSDTADEVHVHGYDLMRDVPAGGSVSFSFPAEIEGIFEVELEEQGEQIAELRVNP